MPVLRDTDAVRHDLHGAAFHTYAAPSLGSAELCAWRLEVPASTVGVTHRPDREEVLLVLRGTMRVELDGVAADADAGDVIVVPAGAAFRADSGPDGASAWVTTTPGMSATLDDGTRVTPPWSR